ncbi:Phospholipase D zeta 1, partial [Sesamum angolense]
MEVYSSIIELHAFIQVAFVEEGFSSYLFTLALKKRAIIEEIHEKQAGDHAAVVHDEDEPDDGAVPIYHDDTVKSRYVPSRAALPIIRPAIGKQQHISDKAKAAMQGYLNHFLGNLDIINSREVCKFLEVSRLSFSKEYGPKMKEGYVMVKHLGRFSEDNTCSGCCLCHCSGCCGNNWRKVWLILKPGFLAFLDNHFDTKLLDIIVFDVLPASNAKGDDEVHLAKVLKERNPLRHAFEVSCGNRNIKLRTTSHAKVQDWVYAINAVGSKRSESWCHPHRLNSFAPIRGLVEDGSLAQWFIDGKAAFEAIALSIESAKSELYMTGWWLCPELYLRRPFTTTVPPGLMLYLRLKLRKGYSLYSKRKLLNIHENVKVLRYPDHLSTGIYLWSHHEKLVIVDHKICFIGGLDLCFGRYDTTEHRVGDFPPFLWPGKDYYNPRESEPNSWEDTLKDELDREKYPRMPWHDVHCAVWGPPCRDIARHFVQRWNHAKGGVDDSGAATVRAIMHWQYRTICRGKSSILEKLSSKLGSTAHDFISFFGLRNYGRLFDGGPVVTSQEKQVFYVLMYILQIAVLIEDKEFVVSSMNGKPWEAGKFAFSLRLSLWAEHLGLHTEEVAEIKDPIAETTYKDFWLEIAEESNPTCTDSMKGHHGAVTSWGHCIYGFWLLTINSSQIILSTLRQSMSHWKQKLRHTTIDLGVAPDKIEFYQNGERIVMEPMTKLKSIRGHLVSFPLEFMSQEDDLRPMFIEGEFYASPQVFH